MPPSVGGADVVAVAVASALFPYYSLLIKLDMAQHGGRHFFSHTPVRLTSTDNPVPARTTNWVSPWLSRHVGSQYSPTGSTRFDVWEEKLTRYKAYVLRLKTYSCLRRR